MLHTGCYRGYVATYAIDGGCLVLDQLRVGFADESLSIKTPMYVVEVSSPDGQKEHHEIFKGQVLIGAEPTNDIVVPGPPYVLNFFGDRFLLLEQGAKPRKLPDREEAPVSAGYAIRPRIVAGYNAVETATLPELHGRAGVWDDDRFGARTVRYQGVALPLSFTGGILACDGFLRELYVHMGFHPAWKFEHVEELIFDDGRLTRRTDVSEELAQVREVLKHQPSGPDRDETILAWVKRTFQLDY